MSKSRVSKMQTAGLLAGQTVYGKTVGNKGHARIPIKGEPNRMLRRMMRDKKTKAMRIS